MENRDSSIIELIVKIMIVSFVIIIILVLLLINYALKIKNIYSRLKSINVKDYSYNDFYSMDVVLNYESSLSFYAVFLIIYVMSFIIAITFLRKLD